MENNIELEDQLISFETAKLAKQKGFNVHCRWHFDDENGDLYENEDFPYNSWNGSLFAPTQSLLQKWLREKHNSEIQILGENPNYYVHYFINNTDFVGKYKHGFKTYEDAVGFGLFELLKSIK